VLVGGIALNFGTGSQLPRRAGAISSSRATSTTARSSTRRRSS
jgi:hypothetical protein